jgi:hypothetical protein
MKKRLRKGIIFFMFFIFLSSPAEGFISLSVNPTSTPANLPSGIIFQIQASEPGGKVQFELYGDFDEDGIIDENEWGAFHINFY